MVAAKRGEKGWEPPHPKGEEKGDLRSAFSLFFLGREKKRGGGGRRKVRARNRNSIHGKKEKKRRFLYYTCPQKKEQGDS